MCLNIERQIFLTIYMCSQHYGTWRIIWGKVCRSFFLPLLTLRSTFYGACMYICVKLLQLCPTLWDPMDCSLPGSSVHGVLQARILVWATMPSCRGPSQPRDQTCVSFNSFTAGGLFTTEPLEKPPSMVCYVKCSKSLTWVIFGKVHRPHILNWIYHLESKNDNIYDLKLKVILLLILVWLYLYGTVLCFCLHSSEIDDYPVYAVVLGKFMETCLLQAYFL